jgi:hypothetical protein
MHLGVDYEYEQLRQYLTKFETVSRKVHGARENCLMKILETNNLVGLSLSDENEGSIVGVI